MEYFPFFFIASNNWKDYKLLYRYLKIEFVHNLKFSYKTCFSCTRSDVSCKFKYLELHYTFKEHSVMKQEHFNGPQ